MKKGDKIALYIVLSAFTVIVLIKIYQDNQNFKALKNSAIVPAKIEEIESSRGATFIHLQYFYKGIPYQNIYATYSQLLIDSLQQKPMVLLRVSKDNPEKYFDYIGVAPK